MHENFDLYNEFFWILILIKIIFFYEIPKNATLFTFLIQNIGMTASNFSHVW